VEGAAAEVAGRAAAAAQRTAARQWASSADDAPLAGIPAEEARARRAHQQTHVLPSLAHLPAKALLATKPAGWRLHLHVTARGVHQSRLPARVPTLECAPWPPCCGPGALSALTLSPTHDPNPVTAQVAEVRGVLAALGAEYATRLRTFVALLPTQAPVDLNFLLFRLEAGKGDAAAA